MIVDGHIHFDAVDNYDKLVADHRRMGAEQTAVLVVGRYSNEPDVDKLAAGLWLKHKHPDRVFLFGGFDYTGLFDGGTAPEVPFERQLQTLIDMGCDGLKLLSGKPTCRKTVNVPLDADVYQPFMTMLEKTQFPVLWHVGDPPEFWDADAVPLWAKKNRWWYDETYPKKELIDREIASCLRQHPKMNLVLPHFFFVSDKLDEAAKLLDTHPSFRLDTTPGIEMQHNFTRNYEASRQFFIKYADRIIMGTDLGMGNHFTGPERGRMVRRWLEESGMIEVAEDPCMTPDERGDIRGLGLPREVNQKIMGDNFHAWVGRTTPRPLNMAKVRDVLREQIRRAKQRGEAKPAAERVLAELGG